jgi:hypothetical protein
MRTKQTRVLPISNASTVAAFNDAWVNRISTTLQRGTGDIIYGVTQGEKAPVECGENGKGPASGRSGATGQGSGMVSNPGCRLIQPGAQDPARGNGMRRDQPDMQDLTCCESTASARSTFHACPTMIDMNY